MIGCISADADVPLPSMYRFPPQLAPTVYFSLLRVVQCTPLVALYPREDAVNECPRTQVPNASTDDCKRCTHNSRLAKIEHGLQKAIPAGVPGGEKIRHVHCVQFGAARAAAQQQWGGASAFWSCRRSSRWRIQRRKQLWRQTPGRRSRPSGSPPHSTGSRSQLS